MWIGFTLKRSLLSILLHVKLYIFSSLEAEVYSLKGKLLKTQERLNQVAVELTETSAMFRRQAQNSQELGAQVEKLVAQIASERAAHARDMDDLRQSFQMASLE